MAKEAALKDVSKAELAEAYSKLKTRTKSAQTSAKKEGEAIIRDAITVASSGGLGYMMGQRHAEGEEEAVKKNLSGEKAEEAIAEAGQVGGIDYDLLVGGAAAAVGLMKLGGKMSDTVRAVGIGGLASWASRMGYEKGEDSVTEAEED